MAWSQEAREAAAAARAAKAGKPQPGKRGPRKTYTSPGTKSAMQLRRKIVHDQGKDARIQAAKQREPGAHSTGIKNFIPGAGLGLLAGLANIAVKGATANLKKGR